MVNGPASGHPSSLQGRGRGRPPAVAAPGNPPSPTLSAAAHGAPPPDHPSQVDALAYLAVGRPELLPFLVPRPAAVLPPAALGNAATIAAAAAGVTPGVPSRQPPQPPPGAGSPMIAHAAQHIVQHGSAATATGVAAAGGSPQLPHARTALDTPLSIPPPNLALPSMDNVQTTDIPTPFIHPNDVLCGRGGGTNNHAGNEKFRDLVNQQKVAYLHSSKRDKPYVSRGIVRAVRAQNPPGRFLQKNEKTGFWYDIGDQKAREKTSQALREGAPEIRRGITASWVNNAPAARGPTIIPPAGYPPQPSGSTAKVPTAPGTPGGPANPTGPELNAQAAALANLRAAGVTGPPGAALAYFPNTAAAAAAAMAAGLPGSAFVERMASVRMDPGAHLPTESAKGEGAETGPPASDTVDPKQQQPSPSALQEQARAAAGLAPASFPPGALHYPTRVS